MSKPVKEYDLVIVGAGPAGCSCAIQLAKSGLRVAIIDKAVFPRPKTCGDGLGTDVIKLFREFPQAIKDGFDKTIGKYPINGLRLGSPNGSFVDMVFQPISDNEPSGYVFQRIDFDNFLFTSMKNFAKADVFENCKLIGINREDDNIHLQTETEEFMTKMVLGADGVNSLVSKQLTDYVRTEKYSNICIRGYYENVTIPENDALIELYFLDKLVPGYFWLFPTGKNTYNVGLCVLQYNMRKKNINLLQTFEDIIHHHPVISHRFKTAKPISKMEGGIIPLGSKKRSLSGDRFLLAGDAASLVDPFLGEGIGNAMHSGIIAAKHIIKCFEKDDFSAEINREYDNELEKVLGLSLKMNYRLQQLVKLKVIFNFVIRKAKKNPAARKMIADATYDSAHKAKLMSIRFLLNLIFR